ncbi:hypothetical protein KY329_03790 [Candidatus Woesearchaeota archaeon]|nr:hypothetical protein [Candidatus Woesearchaeota archaeon]
MKELWFAVVILLVLGVLTGLYSETSVTGNFVANMPPKWDYATDQFDFQGQFTLDLNEAFFDPDGDALSFSVKADEGVAAGIRGSSLVVEVPAGDSSVWVTASDGNSQVVRKLSFSN